MAKFIEASRNADVYSDGDVEMELLKLFERNNYQKEINRILNNDPSWALRYHLSPIRKNLIDWFKFKTDGSILEIGAGCGAITEVFCNKLNKVVANKLSNLRAKIIYNRFRNKNNLTVISGNLNEIKLKEKFDYVSLIGVLEYAGKYTHTKKPYLDFILNAKSHLKSNGTLIIAIENRFGLKYWAGCKEDHTGNYFDSIENYPSNHKIQTFGKYEIKNLLKSAGFQKMEFYYPLPDYKLPIELFSEKYLPTYKHNINSSIFPFNDYSQSREYIFNERLAMNSIISNKQFSFFANSFLIFAKL
jgi:2-polyprenyl-3-methyl-5-hydroxy-6-metoxy-1,4-benzoquinol methylase